MAERLVKEKIKKRERMFASLKRHAHFLETYNAETQCGQIQSRLDKMEKKWEEFEELQEEIAEMDENGDDEEENNRVFGRFENLYFELRAALLAKVAPSIHSTSNLDITVGRNSSSYGFHTGVRLPQISLPDFDGDYRGWLSFKSTYESLIHESAELNDVQKFHYLKSALKGEAAKLIESLTITNGNYAIAWTTITKRYSNEYLLKKRHLQALMEYPKIEKESATAIHGLMDEFEQRLKILKQLGENTESWGALIVHWMCSKLDGQSLQLWEDHAASVDVPTFEVLMAFLEKRTRVLDAVSSNVMETTKSLQKPIVKQTRLAVHATTGNERNITACPFCGETHYMARCAKFLSLSLKEKLEFVNSKRLCSNCFRAGHWVRECNSNFSCRTCGRKHHSLIHPGFPPSNSETANNTTAGQSSRRVDTQTASSNLATSGAESEQHETEEDEPVGSYSIGTKGGASNVFLSTVVLTLRNQNGEKQLARALLDNGSQANIMSERLCQILKLKRRSVNVPICGVGQSESRAKHAVRTVISSRVTEFSVEVDFLVLQRVTSELPSTTVSVSHWKIPDNLQMADPGFNTSSRIDLLIGAEHFYRFLYEREMNRITLGPGFPVLVDTVFGWIVSGKCANSKSHPVNCYLATSSENLEGILERFWKVENSEDQPAWSKEEQDCEAHFINTHERLPDGRYVVRLPRQLNFNRMLGESKTMALERYSKLEKRLERNSEMKTQYHAFIREYIDLGHMRKLSEEEVETTPRGKAYYLPHHAVVKESSTTTKVRVVFDGSAHTDSGFALNDVLLKGPTIQDDLLSLLLRFRKHEVALVGDIEKMYRQVRLHHDDTSLQRILWRFSEHEPIGVYELLTVTYGLTPSSFLAIRTLHQLAADESLNHPRASSVLVQDFYVDDYIGGASTVQAAIQLRKELADLTSRGGFPLRKWCSNRPEVLADIPANQLGTNLSISFELTPGEEVKALGITWDPKTDHLLFAFDIDENCENWTRRRILSAIAKLFDPLGLISPVVVVAKIMMQELALLQSAWDAPVPSLLEKNGHNSMTS
ncbi:uncharacterized protein LOC131679424 [Topomyia yanbarensis]|uniref:uncharacterized protein LOC131679424 n=1 Tax=Topomyia yanbarensis TaxID=2498891 RepID=UPI00273B6BDD|nr:uncharacterized protein LOC131679424 [Topomyia yanbarensis]